LVRPFKALMISLAVTAVMSLSWASFAQEAAPRETEDFDYANGLFSRGMYDLAIEGYREFLGTHPGSQYTELAKYRIGESFFLANKYDEAMNKFSIFLKEYPSGELSEKATLRRGQIFSLQGDRARAEEILTPMISSSSEGTSAAAKYYLGSMYLKNGEYTTAKSMLDGVVASKDPGGYAVFAYMNLGDIYIARKENLKAVEAYSSASKAAKDPAIMIQALFRTANAYYLAEDYVKARELYGKLIDDPEAGAVFEDAALGLLSSMFNAKDYDAVLSAKEALLARAKSDEVKAQMMYIAGSSYFSMARYPEASAAYVRIYTMYPSTKYGRRSGLDEKYALIKQRRFDECLAGLEAFIAANAEMRDEGMYLKAKTLAEMGRKEEALAAYNAVSEMYKDSSFSKESLYEKAWLSDAQGQAEAAIGYFEEFADKYPGDARSPAALLKAAQDNLSLKRFKESEEDYTKFISVFGDSPLKEKVLYQMGMLYLTQENYDKAIRYYSLFLKQYPSSKGKEGAVYSIAQSNQGKREWDKAIEGFIAVTANPAGELYPKAMEGLAYCYFEKLDQEKTSETFYALMTGRPEYKLTENIYQWVADYYLKKGHPEKSIQVLEIRAKHYTDPASSGQLSYMYGENYRRSGDIGNAAAFFMKTIDQNAPAPYLERAHMGMGSIYASKGEYEKAFEEYAKALDGGRDNMTNALARMEMGNVRLKMMEYDAAAKEYMMVAILYDDKDLCSKALSMAAEAFEKAGSSEKALDALKELVTRYPDCELAKKASEDMGRLKK
jgi:tetratricopeptide (TPR) repeat protein